MIKILLIAFSMCLITLNFAVPQQKEEVNKINNPELKGYKIRDFFQMTLYGGFTIPAGILHDTYDNSGNVGIELAYRVNREVAIYGELRYNFLALVVKPGPTSGYYEFSIGPRVYLRSPCYRSSFFFEVGIGPYMEHRGSYISSGITIDPESNFKFGANAGIGGELVLTNNLFFTIKSKYHSVFGNGGSKTYIGGYGGFTVRF